MLDEHVELFERALVQQQIDALASGQLALGVLGFDAFCAAAGLGLLATAVEFLENVLQGDGSLAMGSQRTGRQADKRLGGLGFRRWAPAGWEERCKNIALLQNAIFALAGNKNRIKIKL
jgi:hypothetical protein